MKFRAFLRRLRALCKKETLQILRDPSSNIIAFILPVVMLFIYGYGISLDTPGLRVGLVLEDSGPEARHFADSLFGSPYLRVQAGRTQEQFEKDLVEGRVRGFVVVPPDFARKLKEPGQTAPLLVVTDGAEPNTASFVENYVRGAWEGWLAQRAAERGAPGAGGAGEEPDAAVALEPRFWFNPAAESRNYLIPARSRSS